MKKIAALGLAGLIGASALAMTSTTASAMPPDSDWWRHHHHHDGGWGWGGPFFLGFGLGTYYGYNTYPYRAGWDDHARWCAAHYRTYNPATDTFYIRVGVPAKCVAPFDYRY